MPCCWLAYTQRITAIEIRPTAIEIHGSFLMQKFAKQLAKCICQCKIWTNFVVISFAVWQLCSEGAALSGGLFTRSRLNYFVQKIRRNVQIKTAESHKNKTGNQQPTDDSDQSHTTKIGATARCINSILNIWDGQKLSRQHLKLL